jgi:hypothetical protein
MVVFAAAIIGTTFAYVAFWTLYRDRVNPAMPSPLFDLKREWLPAYFKASADPIVERARNRVLSMWALLIVGLAIVLLAAATNSRP